MPEANALPRLKAHYNETLRDKLMADFGYANAHAVPTLEKIVLNMGVGEGSMDRKKMETAANEMLLIAGQKPVINKAKKSVATFKIRDGMSIGCKVTLRRDRMYEFLDRLINIALPRVRDFRGLSQNSFENNFQSQ